MQQPLLVIPEINSDVTIQLTASSVGNHFDIQAGEKLKCNFFKEIAMCVAVVIAQVMYVKGDILLLMQPQAAALMKVGLAIIYNIACQKISDNREEVTQKETKQLYYVIQLTTVFRSVMIICDAVHLWSKLH